MTIVKVLSDPKSGLRAGDWVVEVGREKVSRHRKKKSAIERAKREARKSGGQVRIQDTKGRWRQGPSY